MDDEKPTKRAALRQSVRAERRERMQTRSGEADAPNEDGIDDQSGDRNLLKKQRKGDDATAGATDEAVEDADAVAGKETDAGDGADEEETSTSEDLPGTELSSEAEKIRKRAHARSAMREERREKTKTIRGDLNRNENGDVSINGHGAQNQLDCERAEGKSDDTELNAAEKRLVARKKERRSRLERRSMPLKKGNNTETSVQAQQTGHPGNDVADVVSDDGENSIDAAQKRLRTRKNERQIRLERRSVAVEGENNELNANARQDDKDALDDDADGENTIDAAVKRLRARQNERQSRLEHRSVAVEREIDDAHARQDARYGSNTNLNVASDHDEDSVEYEVNQADETIGTGQELSTRNENVPLDERVGAYAVWEVDETTTSQQINHVRSVNLDDSEGSVDHSSRQFAQVENMQIRPLDAHVPTNVPESDGENLLVVEGRREAKAGHGMSKKKKMIAAGAVALIMVVGGSIIGAVLGLRPSPSSNLDTMMPTGAPTTEEDAKNAVLSFLAGASTGELFFEPGSFYEAAGKWIVDEDPLRVPINSPELLQRFALVLFYFQTTDGRQRIWKRCNPPISTEDDVCNGISENRWLTGTHECTWAGIACLTGTKTIFFLDLSRNGMVGQVPSTVALLSNIRVLDLGINGFTGTIPEEIYDMTNLEYFQIASTSVEGTISTQAGLLTNLRVFGYGANDLSGTIPSEIGRLSKLEGLSFGANLLIEGTIPDEIFELTKLTQLAIQQMSITGTLSTRIGKLSNLQYFDPASNIMTGLIPSEIGLCSKLTTFFFTDTSFSGQLPSEIGKLSMVDYFSTREALISGTLPEEFYNMTALSTLRLVSPIEGSLSKRIGQLTDLIFLYVDETNIDGILPTELGLLSNLGTLILRQSEITGHIPSEIGLCASLSSLDLSSNNINGTLPSDIGMMRSLERLWLLHNRGISGTLPEELFNLERLLIVDFTALSLSGTVSTLVGNLENIEHLSLGGNSQLTGVIPTEFGLTTNLLNLHLFGMGTTGSIPSELGLATKLRELRLNDSKLTGSVPEEICNLSPFDDLWADCLPVENPPMPCSCCTHCCNRETGNCTEILR